MAKKIVKWKTIVNSCNKIKKSVEQTQTEKNIEGCNKGETLFVLSNAVKNPGKDVEIPTQFVNCPKCTGSSVNRTFKKEEYKKVADKALTWFKTNVKAPNYISWGKEKISVRLANYAFSKILLSYNSNKKLPSEMKFDNNVFYNSKPSKHGHATSRGCDNMGQNNGVYCAPHSMQEVIRNLTGKVISQKQLASWAGTTSGGTGHGGIETAIAMAAKQLGVKLTCKWYNFSDLGWDGIKKILNSNNQDCIIHNLYRDEWGHYEVINKIYDDYCDVQNSLGDQSCGSCYCGYVEERYLTTFRRYMSGISQKSVLVVTMG